VAGFVASTAFCKASAAPLATSNGATWEALASYQIVFYAVGFSDATAFCPTSGATPGISETVQGIDDLYRLPENSGLLMM
jgi:hypothetical protein